MYLFVLILIILGIHRLYSQACRVLNKVNNKLKMSTVQDRAHSPQLSLLQGVDQVNQAVSVFLVSRARCSSSF